MKNYEKIADFCNEDPVLFRQAFVAFAGLGAVKMKHLTPAMFDDKNDLSDEDIEKVVEMAKLMAELSSDALFAIIQRNLPAVEGDDKEVPFLHEFGDEDDICPCCGAEIEYCGEHDPDDSIPSTGSVPSAVPPARPATRLCSTATTRCEMPLDMMSLGATIKEGCVNGTNQQRSLLSQHC